jgi:hypothetical protein
MDTSTSQERKKREIHSMGTKTREIFPTPSTRKNAEALRNRAFRGRKRGTEKICPPCVVVEHGTEPASASRTG